MLAGDDWMAHSLLSAPLNLGLLDPLEVVHARREGLPPGDAPIAAVEGFVRQIMGWRDYVWHLYWQQGRGYRRRNALDARGAIPGWFADLDADERRRALPVRRAARGARARLGAPHPAADGARQLRHAARLAPVGGDRLVPPQLRRRLRLGDGAERRRHVAARRRRGHGDQALRRRRRLHQPDERLLRRLPLRPEGARTATTPARSPPATGRSWTATASVSPATIAWPSRCAAWTGSAICRPSSRRSRSAVRARPEPPGRQPS